jgi:hypothetical protein
MGENPWSQVIGLLSQQSWEHGALSQILCARREYLLGKRLPDVTNLSFEPYDSNAYMIQWGIFLQDSVFMGEIADKDTSMRELADNEIAFVCEMPKLGPMLEDAFGDADAYYERWINHLNIPAHKADEFKSYVDEIARNGSDNSCFHSTAPAAPIERRFGRTQ